MAVHKAHALSPIIKVNSTPEPMSKPKRGRVRDFNTLKKDWKGGWTAQEERVVDSKIEQHFKGHRDAPLGRNAMCFRMRHLDNNKFRSNFDGIKGFEKAPGFGI